MDESARLRKLSLNDLATEMGGVAEGAVARPRYDAEFKRREAVLQRISAIVAVSGVVVSAIAIVVGAASSVRADRVMSEAALARASRPCRLPTLPTDRALTIADLEAGYTQRGIALINCDASRQTAVDMIEPATER